VIEQLVAPDFLLSAADDTRLSLRQVIADRDRRGGDGGPLDELGLDTSYEDAGLPGEQAAWVLSELDANPGLRTALLSHPQLFSPYDERDGKPTSPALREKIRPVLATGRIDAWFWAHEHRCVVYDAHEGVDFASCAGHGGIPEYLVASETDPYPPPMRYDYRLRRGAGLEPWNTFGFAVLELDGPAMRIRYVDEDGRTHHREAL
jgi:hypothetical protein